MTALGKLFRTTAFKLSLGLLAIVALGVILVFGFVAWNVNGLINQQIAQTIDAEMTGLDEQYAEGGAAQLVSVIEARAKQPGAALYLVTTFAGERVAGNVAALPTGVLTQPGVTETYYARLGEGTARRLALARIFLLPGGFRLLVGRDLQDRAALARLMGRALLGSLVALALIGVGGGLFVARRVLRRVDAMSATAGVIMRGDLSGRLAIAGSDDELDRLAVNLNAMLERIGALMSGLAEVSDNIAHDLKTPLTRLRNGAEQALRTAQQPEAYRDALAKIIEEADELIGLFNALLMIARAEAGADRADMASFDASETLRDIGELYEPVAEAEDVVLSVSAEPRLTMRGSRELVAQAVANLIDNALKYGVATAAREITVRAARVGSLIEISVADRGPGVSAADRARVMDRFVRLEPARSQPGSGLGLSLALAVAHLHGGTVRLEDHAPGLRVVMTLASAPPAANAPRRHMIPA